MRGYKIPTKEREPNTNNLWTSAGKRMADIMLPCWSRMQGIRMPFVVTSSSHTSGLWRMSEPRLPMSDPDSRKSVTTEMAEERRTVERLTSSWLGLITPVHAREDVVTQHRQNWQSSTPPTNTKRTVLALETHRAVTQSECKQFRTRKCQHNITCKIIMLANSVCHVS